MLRITNASGVLRAVVFQRVENGGGNSGQVGGRYSLKDRPRKTHRHIRQAGRHTVVPCAFVLIIEGHVISREWL